MIPTVVAERYARALLELGQEAGNVDALVAEIHRMAEAYETSTEMREALDNPLVPHVAKKGIVNDVAAALGVGVVARNAAQLLVDRRRIRALPVVAQRLREMNDRKKGLVRAEVISATPLSDGYYEKLLAQLEKTTGKKIVLDKRVDPRLIAGIVTRIGDTVYDGSLLARLNELKTALTPN